MITQKERQGLLPAHSGKALLAIFLCMVMWGLSFISNKVSVAVFPPLSLGALRFAISVVFLFFLKQKYIPGEKLKLRDVPVLAGAGFTGVTLYFFCENTGVSLISASEASIFCAAIPVLTMAAEEAGVRLRYALRKTASAAPPRIAVKRWTGALISVAGVWLVAGASLAGIGGEKSSGLGYLCMIAAAVSWVIYSFLTRSLFTRCSQIYITFWQNLFGFAGFVPFAIAEYPRWGRPDLPVLAHLLFLGIGCSALGYWFYVISLNRLGVTISALFINFIPAVTAVAGFFMLGERLTPPQWAGAVLVLFGVTLAMMRKRKV
jgi:drug/metabolite transporter (DMT)-like permease